MKALVKTHAIQVRLNEQDARDLSRAARLESKRRGELVGDATLLRELGMLRVRELLATQDAA